MSGDVDFRVNLTQEAGTGDRTTPSHIPSFYFRSPSGQVFTTGLDSRDQNFGLLRNESISQQGVKSGTKMVEKEYQTSKWKTNPPQSSRPPYVLRCSQRGIGGMGGRVSGNTHQRHLDSGREKIEYQRSGTASSGICPKKFSETENKSSSPFKNRQHLCPILHSQDGRHTLSNNDGDSEENMGISELQKYLPDSGICTIKIEHHRGLALQKLEGFKRVETKSTGVSTNIKPLGETRNRPVCIPNISPDKQLLQLVARPRKQRDGCSQTELGPPFTVCFPPVLPDRTVSEEGKNRKHHNNYDYACMGVATLVSPSTGIVDRQPTLVTIYKKPLGKPKEGKSPASSQRLNEIGGMANLRERISAKRVSESALALMCRARAPGTRKVYESAWNQFARWCSEREIDPISCPIDDVINYLSNMFDNDRKYRTINTHRSAISAYHKMVDGVKVGSHPYVKDLMSGVMEENPPLPRYTYIWDVGIVLRKMKDMPDNSELPLGILSHKVVTLLGLCAVKRGSELHALNLKFMSKTSGLYKCYFGSRVKHTKKGKVAPPVEFYPFPSDPKLCPVASIEAYKERTQTLRPEGVQMFFLSTKKPHMPVVKCTIANWITDMLSLSGIDTKKFKAHSVRSAASSKVSDRGFSATEILSMGNWSNQTTWERFYHKKVRSSTENFQSALLNTQALNED